MLMYIGTLHFKSNFVDLKACENLFLYFISGSPFYYLYFMLFH